MLNNGLANGMFVAIVAVSISCLLIGIGFILASCRAKSRYGNELSLLRGEVESKEVEISALTAKYNQLNQDHASLKYELGAIKRDKAYLENQLKRLD